MKLDIRQFKGFTSKPTFDVGNPAVAVDCHNVIIQKGVLKNFPYTIKEADIDATLARAEKLIGLYYFRTPDYLFETPTGTVKVGPDILILVQYTSGIGLAQTESSVHFYIGGPFLEDQQGNDISFPRIRFTSIDNFYPTAIKFQRPNGYSSVASNYPVVGNFVQVGQWLFFCARLGEVDRVFDTDGNIINAIPQMIRFRYDVPERVFYVMPVGVKAPKAVSRVSGTNNTSEDVDLGFSFEQVDPYNGDRVESNVTIINSVLRYGYTNNIFKIELPARENSLAPAGRGVYLNTYARLTTQGSYYLVQQTEVTNYTIEGSDAIGFYISYTLSLSPSTGFGDAQSDNGLRKGPVTSTVPVQGAHDIPQCSDWGVFYKGRMYYLNARRPYNIMQYSMITPPDKVDTGLYANYIEGLEYIGNHGEPFAGGLIFQDHLIIFKQKRTYVLPGDILDNPIVVLFEDIGCCNVDGGHGFIVINEILYFGGGNKKAIYAYVGAGQPLLISDDIQEYLESIPFDDFKYMRMGHHPLYNLLFVSFPAGPGSVNFNPTWPTLIYNIDDQTWTKIDYTAQVVADKLGTQRRNQSSNVLLNKRFTLELLGTVEDTLPGPPDESRKISWRWKSTIIDFGYPYVTKWFKFIQFITNGPGMIIAKLFSRFSSKAVATTDINDGSFRRIDGYTEQGLIELSGETNKSFTIEGLEIEASLKGRR